MGKRGKRKERGRLLAAVEFAVALVALKTLEYLPAPLAYGLGRFLARLCFLVDPRHRRRTATHLLHAGIAADLPDARRQALRNYLHLAGALVDVCRCGRHVRAGTLAGRVGVVGDAASVRRFVLGRPVEAPIIAVVAHYGTWEIIGTVYSLLSGRPVVSVMRPFDNPHLSRYFRNRRIGGQHRTCDKQGALKVLLRALREGESVGIVADQHARTEEGVETTFFGHPARAHVAPALLHLLTGAPIVPAVLHRLGDGIRCELVVAPPIILKPGPDRAADIREIAQRYTTALETLIRREPLQWLWAHRRWLDIDRAPMRSGSQPA
jgi:KDO2-lipid IV(A) lauroyltransferase